MTAPKPHLTNALIDLAVMRTTGHGVEMYVPVWNETLILHDHPDNDDWLNAVDSDGDHRGTITLEGGKFTVVELS